MDAVKNQVLYALKAHDSIRVLGDLPTAELNPEDYLASVSSMIEDFLAAWKEIAETRLLAVVYTMLHGFGERIMARFGARQLV